MSNTIYFAAKEPKDTASVLMKKANAWYNQLHTNGYLEKVREMWMAYHGAYYTSVNGAHRITFGGEQGELVQLAVNHVRNLAQHILTMITSNRPSFQSRATNSDSKSLVQSKLANELLDYYMREKRLEKYLRRAVEYAVVMGSGYIKMDWNATSGEVFDVNEETGTLIYEGDVQFNNLSPYDVVFDTSKEDQNHDWVLCRTFKNKFDLAAKYPEYDNKIKGLETKSDLFKYKMKMFEYDETDDIPVYEFYHKRTEAMPEGRYLLFLSDSLVLMDTPMPYRSLPVYRIAPSDILGTPYGYTPMFDLLPIQDAVNSLYSTILTNQHAFGVQNIYIPRGADISIKSLEGGLNIIEGNSGAGTPSPLNLTQTPAEVFNFLKLLEQQMEILSGVNSVARGNPEASLKTGPALALVQSMALQFISGLQQQYVQLIEDVGTGLINMLKDFAAVPRVAIIAGLSNKSYVEQSFTGDDLSQINRVIVDMGNPLANTTSGKLQIATDLIQYGVVENPQDYVSILTTGQLNTLTSDEVDQTILIKSENEKLSAGISVRVLALDEHLKHIKHHRSVLNDPELREDEALTGIVLEHIQKHIDFLRQVDPAMLNLIGEQALGPVAGTPPPPQMVSEDTNVSLPPNQAVEMMPAPQVPNQPPLPNMPNLPQVNPQLLPNPELQQQNLGNVKE
jgi:hypothetical protein